MVPGELQAVKRVSDTLPPGGEIVHIFAFPARERRKIGLVVRRIDEVELPGFLERLEWPGELRTVKAVLSKTRGLFETLRLLFEVSARGVSSRLGL